ncbi:class I SAM-dependent methyltransferase [Amycolatopsis sp. NPDC059021]|uniref:class I SAM-dependent methyltransferase n=1 Tax=Amycolatopsis sp. NPDC059021 TaxID=3346704 RepID=UPI0036700BA9
MTTILGAGPGTLRPALLGPLRGTVLELGPGSGVNLPFYTPRVRWIGIEPDAGNRERTRRAAERLGRRALVLPGRGERIDLPDGFADAAVATFVLCSVDDPDAVLAQLHRVLRPGGKYVFGEHVAAPPGSWVRRGQDVWALFTRRPGSCRPNRDSEAAITRAGFDIVEPYRFTLPGPLGVPVPHIAGSAVRS